jgi:hypothetical protein
MEAVEQLAVGAVEQLALEVAEQLAVEVVEHLALEVVERSAVEVVRLLVEVLDSVVVVGLAAVAASRLVVGLVPHRRQEAAYAAVR